MADPTELTEEQQAQVDFDAGAAMETPPPKTGAPKESKPEPKPPTEPAPVTPAATAAPDYVQITKEQFAKLTAAADKTDAIQRQVDKAFGTLGDMQQLVRNLQAGTSRGLKVEIPRDAFAAMAKDFPELAEHTRAALEASLRGIVGTGPAAGDDDPERMRKLVKTHVTELEMTAFDDAYPDWRSIVGVPKPNEAPDPNNAFRKWLATKEAAYSARINATESPAVLQRAIRLFQAETRVARSGTPPAGPRDRERQVRLREAIQPRGDGGQPSNRHTSDEDEFAAGFATG